MAERLMTWEVRNATSDLGHGEQRCLSSGGGGSEPDSGAGAGDLCSGRRGGDLRHAGVGRAVAAGGRTWRLGQFASDTVGHAAHLSEAPHDETPEKAGPQGRSRRKSPAAAGANRRAERAPGRMLSALPGSAAALRRDAHAIYRRHSRRHSADRYRAHNSSRLVSALQESGRTAGARCLAGRPDWQSGGGLVLLAALRTGQYALANCRGLQPTPAFPGDAGWAGTAVVSL